MFSLTFWYRYDNDDKRNQVPCVCGVCSAGPYSVVDLYVAGGVPFNIYKALFIPMGLPKKY